ncbi:DUF3078 domain-containing protein [Flavobacterium sp. CS20]|uniref:DUF3078 domain-containing protein n=1 Tax=Flavobacterium sp. CS20 TaxID=2775246 RepID=UPI001B3A55C8|nr:DUF3078 domain-containing protein [Flavobacterium sp. CS20]QTY26237.1 DUF3078 domain-containing protein [Flavobacterium sp. CS20]
MKKFLLLAIFPIISFAQNDSVPKIWKNKGNFSLLFSQSAFNNEWQSGGTSNYLANAVINYEIIYSKDKWEWDTKLLADYGISKNKDQEFLRKTSDRLEINSVLGHQINESHWYFSAFANILTQFDRGYEYSEDNNGQEIRTLETKFLSPGFFKLGLGTLWKKSDNLKVNFAPATVRFITADDRFTTTPGYVDGDFYGLNQGETIRTEFGASVGAYAKFPIMENITLENILNLYSNYLEDPQNVDIDYTLNLNLTVNKYITTNFTFQAIYDDNAIGAFQIREVLGVGLNYKFK